MNTRISEGSSALFSEMIPDPSDETEFNDWYDREHIPLRMGVPGFLSAQRYLTPATRHYFVVYEMSSLMVLKTTPYQQIKNSPSERSIRMLRRVTGFTRYIGEQIGAHARESSAKAAPIDAPYVRVDFFNVLPEHQMEFNNWYEREHIPALLKSKDWLMIRHFSIVDGEPEKYTHLSLHYLADTPDDSASTEPALARAPYWSRARHLVFARHGVRHAA